MIQPNTAVYTASRNQPHLLVIDDDAINRELMRRLFNQDFIMTCVSTGRAGLDALERDSFDVVLLDIMMPDMNGFEVLEHIRNSPDNEDLPVICHPDFLNDGKRLYRSRFAAWRE
jgi:CheY-like chemotaxis protein